MEGEGDVLKHHQAVSNSNAGQDEIDGVGPHVPVGQHQYVQNVEQRPNAAHND